MNRQPDMRQLVKQAQELQQQLADAQAELAERRYEGTAGGGVVKATVSGKPELIQVEISPEVVDPDDVEMLEDLVVAAVRQAMEAVVADASSRLGGMGPGADLGGLLG